MSRKSGFNRMDEIKYYIPSRIIKCLHLLFMLALFYSNLRGQADYTFKSLDSMYTSASNAGQLDEAVHYARLARDQARVEFGIDDSIYADYSNKLAVALLQNGDYASAKDVMKQAQNELSKISDENFTNYLNTLHNLACCHYFLGEYENAREVYIKELEVLKKDVDKHKSSLVSVFHGLGLIESRIGSPRKALNYFLQAYSIIESYPDFSAAESAPILNSLGIGYSDINEYDSSLVFMNLALDRHKIAAGELSRGYLSTLGNIAIIHYEQGRRLEALDEYIRCVQGLEAILGTNHPDVIRSKANLAAYYAGIGRYQDAERCYLEALPMLREIYGESNPIYNQILSNYGSLLDELHDDKTLSIEFEVLKNDSINRETESRIFAAHLQNAGYELYKQGKYDEALKYVLQAKSIFEKLSLNTSNDYYNSIVLLGKIYRSLNRFEESEANFSRVLNLMQLDSLRCGRLCAVAYGGLGELNEFKGNYASAEKYYTHALNIFNEIYFSAHAGISHYMNKLSKIHLIQGDTEHASSMIIDALALDRKLMKTASKYQTERQLEKFGYDFKDHLSTGLSILDKSSGASNASLRDTLFNAILFFKGFLMESSRRFRTMALTSPESAKAYNEFRDIRSVLYNQYAKPASERSNVDALEAEAELLEKKILTIANSLPGDMEDADWRNIQKRLGDGECVIEFIRYVKCSSHQEPTAAYAAMLVKKTSPAPEFISLFEENDILPLINDGKGRRADYVSDLYSFKDRGFEIEMGPQKSLYEIIWRPLEASLKEIQKITFSASGLLHRINIGAIGINEESTVSDHFNLTEVSSTRQVLHDNKSKDDFTEAVIFGGITYDMDSVSIATSLSQLPPDTLSDGLDIAFNYNAISRRDAPWNFLKGTERESQSIEKIIKAAGHDVQLYSLSDATEESFDALGREEKSPTVIHIATHGFFFPDVSERNPNQSNEDPIFKLSEHSMIRSGLLLSGANYAWQYGRPLTFNMDDGILTAYEISQLNLSNTELVVLSACETGLGDIKGNEGVYGLQRAFKIAGVKNIIMSLWKVADKQTQELMTLFYTNWFERKMTIHDAFHGAQQEMRDKYADPYFWAGFVLVE